MCVACICVCDGVDGYTVCECVCCVACVVAMLLAFGAVLATKKVVHQKRNGASRLFTM